jgi:predicted transcriptional regulator
VVYSEHKENEMADKNDDTVGISVRVPRTTVEELDRIAKDTDRTRGNVVRIALRDWIAAHKGKK